MKVFEKYIPENTKSKLPNGSKFLPINSRIVFEKLIDEPIIIMACNTRITHTIPGIMRAAEELDAIVAFELAKTECNLEVGYTGLTPYTFIEKIFEHANRINFTKPFIIHADHQTVKNITEEEISSTENLIETEIDAGYTSFAIDASYNELDDNIAINERLTPPILKLNLGLEVEVGEIKLTKSGGELTTVDEAIYYISNLVDKKIKANLLAINNGSKHGNYAPGEEVHIDLERTGDIYNAIRKYDVAIAQHGITGTPLDQVGKFADYGIRKGNVGTNWQNIAHENLPKELLKEMKKWAKENKKDIKHATKQFFKDIINVDDKYKQKIEDASYHSAKEFITAFRTVGSVSKLKSLL